MSQDFATGETAAARADYLVELRGFEPSTASLGEVALLRDPISRPFRSLQTGADVSFVERRAPFHRRNVG